MDKQNRTGRSTPSLSLAPPLDCQDVSKYKAVDPSYLGEKNPPLTWRDAVLIISQVWMVIIMFTLLVWMVRGHGQ
jgi:hypothetical protein